MPPAHTFALFWSRCLSDSVRGVSWDFTLTNLFLVIVRFAIQWAIFVASRSGVRTLCFIGRRHDQVDSRFDEVRKAFKALGV